MRRPSSALAAAGAVLAALWVAVLPLGPGRAAEAVPVLVIDGRGFGHGVGMAQDGALAMGRAGAKVEQILGHFYPGTGIGRAGGDVRVVVHDAGQPGPAAVELAFPEGGRVQQDGAQSEGFPVEVPPGGQVRVVWDGSRYRVEKQFAVALAAYQVPVESTTTTSAPSTTTTSPPATTLVPSSTTSTTAAPPPGPVPTSTTSTSAPARESTTTTEPGRGQVVVEEATSARPLWATPGSGAGTVEVRSRQRRYRGLLHLTAGAGRLRVLNQVDVETYLKGMGEVRDPSWPPAALRAQAIAARTYALRAMGAGGELCDTQRCQVYLGATAEYAAMNKAVTDTTGQVLVHRRALASAVYSANGGGHSASVEEGFGSTFAADYPYLRPAPYATGDPLPWSVVVALADVAARLRYPGELTGVDVARTGPSGRVLEVVLSGTAGPRPVRGIDFDAALGLRSTLFTLRVDVAEAPAAPPPAEAVMQAPPELAAEVAGGGAPAGAAPVAPGERASRSRPAPVAVAVPRPGVDPSPFLAAGAALGALGAALSGWTVRRLLPAR